MLFQPNLAKAAGSDYIARRIEELRPIAHVFGALPADESFQIWVEAAAMLTRPRAATTSQRPIAHLFLRRLADVISHLRRKATSCWQERPGGWIFT